MLRLVRRRRAIARCDVPACEVRPVRVMPVRVLGVRVGGRARRDGALVVDELCGAPQLGSRQQACGLQPCTGTAWVTGGWCVAELPDPCAPIVFERELKCKDSTGQAMPEFLCSAARPDTQITDQYARPAPRLRAPRPHLHRDWAHPCHICTGTGLAPPHGCARALLARRHFLLATPAPTSAYMVRALHEGAR